MLLKTILRPVGVAMIIYVLVLCLIFSAGVLQAYNLYDAGALASTFVLVMLAGCCILAIVTLFRKDFPGILKWGLPVLAFMLSWRSGLVGELQELGFDARFQLSKRQYIDEVSRVTKRPKVTVFRWMDAGGAPFQTYAESVALVFDETDLVSSASPTQIQPDRASTPLIENQCKVFVRRLEGHFYLVRTVC